MASKTGIRRVQAWLVRGGYASILGVADLAVLVAEAIHCGSSKESDDPSPQGDAWQTPDGDKERGTGGSAGTGETGETGGGSAGTGGTGGAAGSAGGNGTGGTGGGPTRNSCIGGLDCGVVSCCESVVVPGGTFAMGRSETTGASDYYADGQGDEIPEHPATVESFALDKFEVTVGRFRKFVELYLWQAPVEDARANPSIAGSGWQSAWDGQLPTTQGALSMSMACEAPDPTWTATAGPKENYPINWVSW